MWALIGEYNDIYQEKIGGPFEHHYSEEVVALFTSKERAEQYINKSKLKQPKRRTFCSDKIFRTNSLLSRCIGARVEEWTQPQWIVDPEI